MDHVALAVGQDLELDVAGAEDQLFHIELPVPEAGHRLRLGGGVEGRQVLGGVHPAHAAAAAAGAGLDEDGVADGPGDLQGLLGAGDGAVGAGDHRHAIGAHQVPGGGFVAHLPDHVSGGADELQSALLAQVGELRVLGEEAVARVDGVTAGLQGGGEDGGHVEVALPRLGGADAHRLGGQLHVEGVGVGGGVHRHRLDLHLPAGADDAHGDLAPVGDQDAMEHILTTP